MGKKDVIGKVFFSDRERFAELINTHLYHGKKVLLAENLVQRKRDYPSLIAACGEKSRDILMEDIKRKIYYGIELETESDYSMPERVMVYDACEYEYQIKELRRRHKEKNPGNYREKKSRMNKNERLCPAVTVVLYLGEGRWEGQNSLRELFGTTEGEEEGQNIRNYDFLLLEADFLNPDDYCTDMKEFFRAVQCRQERGKLKELLRSDEFQELDRETELAIAMHLNMKKLVRKMEKEELPMCKAFNDLLEDERKSGIKEGMEKGIEKGVKRGKKEGKTEERLGIIKRMKREGMDKVQIFKITKCTEKEYRAAEI